MSNQTIVACTFDRHASQILDIFNDAILTSTALYDYQPRTMDTMRSWFAAKTAGHFPVIGIENDDGVLIGFGSYGAFRAFPAYKYTVEHSVYVHKDHRSHGVGRILMREIIGAAHSQGFHAVVGAIDAANSGSVALHQSLGFQHVGTMPQVGFKFGRWLDLAFYQLLLEGPQHPVDG